MTQGLLVAPVLDLIAWVLIALWAGLLWGGFVFGQGRGRRQRMPRWTRILSSLVLVLLGWYGFGLARAGTPAARYALGIAAGMTFGFVGDLHMAFLRPASNRVGGGMAAFGVGHLIYMGAIVGYGGLHGPALGVWLLMGAVMGWFVLLRGQRATALRGAAWGYALFLSGTAGVATGLALRQPHFALLAVGAFLFLVSDLVLAGELFAGWRFPYLGDVIWLLYGPGQALIVLSIWSALQQPGAA